MSELILLQIVKKQESGEEKEPGDGNGAEKVREHFREEVENVGTVQR